MSIPETCDVAIIGGGPAGLATATRLKQLGVDNVIILERETQAGGIPRHCGHPPFGMREFKRILSGPAYAAKLVGRANKAGVKIYLNTSVVQLHEQARLSVSTDNGVSDIQAKIVVLATGVRETPRSARLVSGQRPMGVLTTGALQSMVYLKQKIPFKRPVIVGSELVSFSSLLTCRHAGIKPVGMIESNRRVTARHFAQFMPALFGVPLYLETSLVGISGQERVTSVRVASITGWESDIDCDGVLFTGQFIPEAALVRMSDLELDLASSGPFVNQLGQCSDPQYFATGNLLRPVETAGWSWAEGVQCANTVAAALAQPILNEHEPVEILTTHPLIKYVMPQVLTKASSAQGMKQLQLRFVKPAKGELSLSIKSKTVWTKKIDVLPERRILIPIPDLTRLEETKAIEIHFEEK